MTCIRIILSPRKKLIQGKVENMRFCFALGGYKRGTEGKLLGVHNQNLPKKEDLGEVKKTDLLIKEAKKQ